MNHSLFAPAVSIIIVTYNSRHHLAPLFASLETYCPSGQLIVIDNASTDGTPSEVARLNPSALLISSDVNHGFARGNNLAVLHAVSPYLLLLNADAYLRSPLDEAISLLESRPEIGVVGARMLGRDEEYRFSCGYFPFFWRLPVFSWLYRREGAFGTGDFGESSSPYEVDWVEGSFLLTRNSIWQQLGGLDEGYFMYVEDIDYCKRVLDAGYKTVYLPSVLYKHVGGYEHGRFDLLIKGLRRFNATHATAAWRLAANTILDIGLIARSTYSLFPALVGSKIDAVKVKLWLRILLDR